MTSEFIVAVHSVVFLNANGKAMTSEEIAVNVCTNAARIRKVMAKLKKANLIETKEGAVNGGYRFSLDPKSVTLKQIFLAVDSKVVSANWKTGNKEMDCLISSGMAAIIDHIMDKMDSSCLNLLNTITIDDIDKQIFKKGNEKNDTI